METNNKMDRPMASIPTSTVVNNFTKQKDLNPRRLRKNQMGQIGRRNLFDQRSIQIEMKTRNYGIKYGK